MDTSLDKLKIPTTKDIPDPLADELVEPTRDPLEFMLDVMQGKREATQAQLRAAVAAAQYIHTKTHDGGKKKQKDADADEAAKGRFGGRQTPLKLVSGA